MSSEELASDMAAQQHGVLASKCCVSCTRRSPFFLAVEEGDATEVARFVREDALWLRHADKKNRRTAWHIAAEKGHVEVLRVLRDRAVEEDAGQQLNNHLSLSFSLSLSARLMSLSRTPLGPEERVAELVNGRSAWGLTPLSLAAAHDRADAVNFLLEIGADPWQGDHEGRNAAHLAAKYGAIRALQVLLGQERPLSSRAVIHNHPSTRLADCLDLFGWTPLHYATWCNRRSAMMLLIGFDANLIARSLLLHSEYANLPAGSTPLHIACLHGCLDRVRMLLRAYYETAADLLPSQTALLASVERRRRARSHPDPRLILTRTQRLPFHVAARSGHRHLLDWLDPSVPLMFLFGGEEADESGGGQAGGGSGGGVEGAEARRRSGQVPLVGVSRLTVIAARALHSSLLASLDAAEKEMRRAAEAAEAAAQERRRRREMRRVAKEAAAAAAALKQGKEPPPEGLTSTIRRFMGRASKDEKPVSSAPASASAAAPASAAGNRSGGGWRPWRHRGRRARGNSSGGGGSSGGGAAAAADGGGEEHAGGPAPPAHSRSSRRRGTRRRRPPTDPQTAESAGATPVASAAVPAVAAAAAAQQRSESTSPEGAAAAASANNTAGVAVAVATNVGALGSDVPEGGSGRGGRGGGATAAAAAGAAAPPSSTTPPTSPMARSSRSLLQLLQPRPSDTDAPPGPRRSRIWGGGAGDAAPAAVASNVAPPVAAASAAVADADSDTCSSVDGGGGGERSSPGLTRKMLRRLYRVALGRRGSAAAGSRAHGHAALVARLHRAGIQIPEGPDEAVAYFTPGREPRYNMPTRILLPGLAAPRWAPTSPAPSAASATTALSPDGSHAPSERPQPPWGQQHHHPHHPHLHPHPHHQQQQQQPHHPPAVSAVPDISPVASQEMDPGKAAAARPAAATALAAGAGCGGGGGAPEAVAAAASSSSGEDAAAGPAERGNQGRCGGEDIARVLHAGGVGMRTEGSTAGGEATAAAGGGGGGTAGGSAFLTQMFLPRESADALHAAAGALPSPTSPLPTACHRPGHLPSLSVAVHLPSSPSGSLPPWSRLSGDSSSRHLPLPPGRLTAASSSGGGALGGVASTEALPTGTPLCCQEASEVRVTDGGGSVSPAPSSVPLLPRLPLQPSLELRRLSSSSCAPTTKKEPLQPPPPPLLLPPSPMAPSSLLPSPAGATSAADAVPPPARCGGNPAAEGPLESAPLEEGRGEDAQLEGCSLANDGNSSGTSGDGGGDDSGCLSMQLPGTADTIATAVAEEPPASSRCRLQDGGKDAVASGGGGDGGGADVGDVAGGGGGAQSQSASSHAGSDSERAVEELPLLGEHAATSSTTAAAAAADADGDAEGGPAEADAAVSPTGSSTAAGAGAMSTSTAGAAAGGAVGEPGWRLSSQLGRVGEGARLLLQSLRNTLRRTSQAQVVPLDSTNLTSGLPGSRLVGIPARGGNGRSHNQQGAHAGTPRGIRLGIRRPTVHLARPSHLSSSNVDNESTSADGRSISDGGGDGATAAAAATGTRRRTQLRVGGGSQGSGPFGRRSMRTSGRRGARGSRGGQGGNDGSPAPEATPPPPPGDDGDDDGEDDDVVAVATPALSATAPAGAGAGAGGGAAEQVQQPQAADHADGSGEALSDTSTGSSTAGGASAVERSGDSEEDVCPVCLEDAPNLLVQACRHPLCINCARDLVKRHSLTPALCPYCRGIISSFKPRLLQGGLAGAAAGQR
ncbi:hypothetical protein Agub_g6430 [Astrephomene gubernaculifera]|uniref:RING-type domain-containing protein n=1 Tax=Astrephomene gubernaculifera TaxID=47775 RepID=A0AAD3DR25_9CHLO|nr:hypothetical protein Agub_g6430 [Astrephomene gubernaculifera]